jgi:DNA-binding GntR family transcriptional regulator
MRVACLARDFALIAEFDIEFHRSIVRRAHEKELESIWSSIVGRGFRGFRGHTYLCFGLGHPPTKVAGTLRRAVRSSRFAGF